MKGVDFNIFSKMKLKELYEQLCLRIPVKQYDSDPTDFRGVLQQALKDYLSLMEMMRKESILSDENVDEVKRNCKKLNEIVTSIYQGLHSRAFTQLSNLLKGNSKQPSLGSSILIYKMKAKEMSLYRMRKMENRRDVKYMDLFHIPLNKRGFVYTNRYSSSGYPCLYLGTSIYACWEELGRPPMSQSMVARLSNDVDIQLLDLRIPTLQQFSDHIIDYIRAFPIIIACSVKVKEVDALFKPEYVIPQLLMEYVINNNVNHKTKEPISGIYYTSVFKNEDFGFGIDKLENIAIPVQSPLSSKKFCRKLCNMFSISKSTCDEMEQARTGGYSTIEYDGKEEKLVFHQGGLHGYEYSSFGYLEKRLNDERLFPLIPINDG